MQYEQSAANPNREQVNNEIKDTYDIAHEDLIAPAIDISAKKSSAVVSVELGVSISAEFSTTVNPNAEIDIDDIL